MIWLRYLIELSFWTILNLGCRNLFWISWSMDLIKIFLTVVLRALEIFSNGFINCWTSSFFVIVVWTRSCKKSWLNPLTKKFKRNFYNPNSRFFKRIIQLSILIRSNLLILLKLDLFFSMKILILQIYLSNFRSREKIEKIIIRNSVIIHF